MGKYFGTDGFRGEANKDLMAVHAFKVGLFLGWYFKKNPDYVRASGRRDGIVVGKDTRRSSYMLEDALAAGIVSAGSDAYMLHVTTTPSVSFVTRTELYDCGVMISASHNSFEDNGIKIVNGNGEKLSDEVIADIESYLAGEYRPRGFEGESWEVPLARGAQIGKVIDHSAGRNRYIGYLISISTCSYKDVKVGLDCANGSAWQIAKSVFDALGASTYVIGDEPDGLNINRDCGSTHIGTLRDFVRQNKLDCGFAFDGDADRCLAVDENGDVVDGDAIMYMCAKHMKKNGELDDSKLVTTVMSNYGLYKALDELGIEYETTQVGDRYVYEKMLEEGHLLGGEQSGHIIFKKHGTSGDGIITAIKVMRCMLEQKLPLSALHRDLELYPQILKNVEVTVDKDEVLAAEKVKRSVQEETKRLAGRGRVLLRKSGTEPVIRVMAEAATIQEAQKSVDNMIAAIAESGMLLRVR